VYIESTGVERGSERNALLVSTGEERVLKKGLEKKGL